jgi:hypothetical protein
VKRALLPAFLAIVAARPAHAQAVRPGGIFTDELIAAPAGGPTDLRFFGTYCLPAPTKFCKDLRLLPDPCVTVESVRTRLDHLTTRSGGLLRGAGTLVVDGERGNLAVAGSVIQRGRTRLAGVIPGLGRQQGEATLSADGLALTATTQNLAITLRKDACGNNPPQVALTAPFGPSFPFGQSVSLGGQITDEDTQFPVERLVFTSDRQGLIPGTRVAGGRTLSTTALVPGNHRVTLTVTDSGGLVGQGHVDITILNRPPELPKIIQPAAGADLAAGGPVLLRGTAFDPDSGQLPPGALTWSAQLAPGGPFVALGSGNEMSHVFAAPADPVLIRLTASDNTAQQTHAERHVRVVAGTGNAPPNVAIRLPDPFSQSGLLVSGAMAGFPMHFLGDAWDSEDLPGDLQLRWEFVAILGVGGPPDPSPPVPNPAPVTGTLAPTVVFSAGPADMNYRVTFTATDSGGLSRSESVEIFVIPGPIL